jgi:membrane dipeptidase
MPDSAAGSRSRRLVLALVAVAVVWWGVSCNVERLLNRVADVPLPEVSPRASSLHASSVVVDLHADTAMVGRDLLERSSLGHVDLPRLREGGVGLQFFTAPTRVPLALDIHHTSAEGLDLLTVFGIAKFNAFAVEGPYGRGMIQAERVRNTAARSGGEFVLVRSRADLRAWLEARAENPRIVAGVFGLEGAHALEGEVDRVEDFYEAGVRMIGLTHFFDNDFAGSAHGVERRGLSQEGRALVRRMDDLGILIDLAHLSPDGIDDVLAITRNPTVVSHTGVKGTCDNPRNLSDRHVRAIAAGGGVIGIGYWEMAVCGIEPRFIVAAMLHVINLVGEDHVALGSDYDGSTQVAFDTSRLPVLTEAMLDAGLGEAAITKILGANTLRVISDVFPER